ASSAASGSIGWWRNSSGSDWMGSLGPAGVQITASAHLEQYEAVFRENERPARAGAHSARSKLVFYSAACAACSNPGIKSTFTSAKHERPISLACWNSGL